MRGEYLAVTSKLNMAAIVYTAGTMAGFGNAMSALHIPIASRTDIRIALICKLMPYHIVIDLI